MVPRTFLLGVQNARLVCGMELDRVKGREQRLLHTIHNPQMEYQAQGGKGMVTTESKGSSTPL